jgi:hypothetical protein
MHIMGVLMSGISFLDAFISESCKINLRVPTTREEKPNNRKRERAVDKQGTFPWSVFFSLL